MRELNLIPQTYSKEKQLIKQKRTVAMSVIVIAIALVGGGAYVFGKESLMEMKKQQLIQKVQTSQELVSQNERLKVQMNLTKEHIEKAKQLSVLKARDTDGIMNELSKLFPNGVTVANLELKTDGNFAIAGTTGILTIEGFATNKDELQKFWANLRESDKFSASHINSIVGSDKNILFDAEIIIIGVNGNAEIKNEQ